MQLGRRGSRSETVVGVLAGAILGYIGWLATVSIADAIATVSGWSVILLILWVVLGGCAVLWGRRLRRRQNHPWAAFAFALPVLPVVLSLSVLTDTYL
jgi:heme O synthase-like polyprenyltransferase